MRLALCQLNPTVGDLPSNVELLVDAVGDAASDGADLIVLPELAVVGYPPQDLLDERDIVDEIERRTGELVRAFGDAAPRSAVAFGTVARAGTASSEVTALCNLALLAEGGREIARRAKSLLPTYDVFDEWRWFRPATENAPVEWRGHRLGLTVCEDAWNDEEFWQTPRHARDPIAELAASGASVLVNLSASPYHRGRIASRESMLAATARRHGLPLAFCNQVGGNDELIFDGSSCVLAGDGRVVARAASFESQTIHVELDADGVRVAHAGMPAGVRVGVPDDDAGSGGDDAGSGGDDAGSGGDDAPPPPDGDARELRRALVLGLSDYARKTGFEHVVLGLSGGIDSAVVAALAADAFGGDRVEAVLMPSRNSSAGSVTDARELCRRFGLRETTLPIEPAHAALHEVLGERFPQGLPSLAEQNIQARIRGLLLMAVSNADGALVLATGNKSELAVGYSTLYGDLAGGLAVIGDCPKGWVREIARDVNADGELIPAEILEKPPSAELAPDQRDEDDLPPYETLDRILERLVVERAAVADLIAEGHAEELVRDVKRRLERSEYKRRQAPPILRVSRRSFGPGRRLPIARGHWLP